MRECKNGQCFRLYNVFILYLVIEKQATCVYVSAQTELVVSLVHDHRLFVLFMSVLYNYT